MSDLFASLSIAARIALGAIAWAVILVLAWAIHPVDAVAEYAPVATPTPQEQASIDRVVGDSGETSFFVSFECSSTPIQAATGTASPLRLPVLEPGFEFVDVPCTRAYESARAAAWVNIVAIGTVLAGAIALQIHQSRRPSVAVADDELVAR